MTSARIASAQGQFERAAKLLGAANSIILAFKHDLSDIDGDTAVLREQLGKTAFAAAWSKGGAMTFKQVISYAFEDSISPPKTPLMAHAAGQALTDRELEILRLIADGLDSREIAERLILSVGTIRWYFKLIYNKLDVHSRSEAIARAKNLMLLA